MKKVKVLNHHVHSDSSLNVSRLIEPMHYDLSPCLADGNVVEKELTDVPNQHVQPASTLLFSQTDKETDNMCFSSLVKGDKQIVSN